MTTTFAVALAREALIVTIVVSAPMLLIGLIVGLAISIFQTTTSIQEQTLTFVPKIFAIFFSVVVFGPWMMRLMADYIVRLFTRMAAMGLH